MERQWDILGFGAVAVDDILYVDGFPLPDAKTPVRQKRREGGGLVGTALVAAARLGARTAYCGVLGDDELSRFTREQLEREGVDCSFVLHDAGARPHYSVIIVDRTTGQRSILAMHDGVIEYPPEKVTADLIANCRVVFVDHHGSATAMRAATLALRHGIPVVADIERLDGEGIHDLIPHVDHLIIGLELGRRLTGAREPEDVLHHLAASRACCAVTDGARGCWYRERGGAVQLMPAFMVPVVDTTGCGDVFHGAYAACIARGEPVSHAIRVATAAAGLKAGQPGGRTGIPHRAAVERFLREHA